MDVSEEEGGVTEGEMTEEGDFVDIGSDTTSVRKKGWRHRKVKLDDNQVHNNVMALLSVK